MERKWHRLSEEESQEGTEREITAYGVPLSQVTSFKYLGRVLAKEDGNCPEVVRNLWRARQKWLWLTHVLIEEGADDRKSEHIYLLLVQSVLLYGSEKWVMTPHMQRVLGVFHHRVARRLTGKQPRKGREGGWVYPLLEYAMAEAGLQEVET